MKIVLAVLCVAQLLLIVDVVVVNVALPAIQRELRIPLGQLQLTSVAYTLVFGGLLIVAGRLGDLFGRRRLLLVGVALFTVASLLSGAAQDGWQLFAARALQGLGAALISPNALALLTSIFPEGDKRNQAFGLWAAVGSGGAIAGQVLGGALTDTLGWRSIFLVNVPVGVALFLVAIRTLPESRSPERQGVDVYALFRNGTVRTGNLVLALNAAALTATLYFTTLYLQVTLGHSAFAVGAGFAPVTAIVLIVSPIAGRAIGRVGARRMLVMGGTAAATGMLHLARAPEGGSYVFDVLPGLALIALGSGLSYAPTFALGTSGVADADQGLAAGLLGTAQELGAGAGLALLAALAVALAGAADQVAGGELAGYRIGYLGACAVQLLAVGISAARLAWPSLSPVPLRP